MSPEFAQVGISACLMPAARISTWQDCTRRVLRISSVKVEFSMRSTALRSARPSGEGWLIEAGEKKLTAHALVNAAGAWADEVAHRCGVAGLNVTPYRRTVVQLRIGRSGLKDLPLVIDGLGRFYFKGESDNRVWVSPHDETPSEPCDTAPEEIDVARAIDHFQSVVDWPIEAVERKWAGLRTFTPARIPAYGFDPDAPGFFWCAGKAVSGSRPRPRRRSSPRHCCWMKRRTKASPQSIPRSSRRADFG